MYKTPIIILAVLATGATLCLADPRFGSLKLTSQPDSAVVVLDGTMLGRAPVEAQMITPGKHQLVVFKKGFKTYDRALAFECGKRTVGRIRLDPLPADAVHPADSAGGDIPAKDDTAGIVRMPVLVRHPKLNFSDAYIRTSNGAYSFFALLVDEGGRVLIVEKLGGSGDQVFDRDASAVIRKWRFEPALRAGDRPCMAWTTYRYTLVVTEDRRQD